VVDRRRSRLTGDVLTGDVFTGDVFTVCGDTSGGDEGPPDGSGPEITGLMADTGPEMACLVCGAPCRAAWRPSEAELSLAFFHAPGTEKSASP